jgi:selenocysteine-specific elongation factor
MVVDPAPRRRHRRFRPEVIERLETLAHGAPEEILLQALEAEQPCEARLLVERVALPLDAVSTAVNALLAEKQLLVLDDLEGTLQELPRPEQSARYLVSAFGWREISERLVAALNGYHRSHPMRQGMPREELRSRLQQRLPGLGGRLFNQMIARALYEGVIVQNEINVWAAEHVVRFSSQQQSQVDALLARFRREGYTSPSVADSVALVGEDVFLALVEKGTLVRLSEDVVYLKETFEEMQARVVEQIRQTGSMTIAQVRDLFGASRKYALALMEYLDEQRVTRRRGDTRVLR